MCNCKPERRIDVWGKVSDMFGMYNPRSGDTYNGYVVEHLGIGSGDAIDFTFCLNCGQISGKWPAPLGVEDIEGDEDEEYD